jgi:hypothetical protein
MDVIARRKALAGALSAHDLAAVATFLDRSFKVRGSDGVVVLEYGELIKQLPQFFDRHPEYRQTVDVEASKIEGDVATLTTRHVEVLKTWRRPHDVPSRWEETWRKVGADWLLADERPAK